MNDDEPGQLMPRQRQRAPEEPFASRQSSIDFGTKHGDLDRKTDHSALDSESEGRQVEEGNCYLHWKS